MKIEGLLRRIKFPLLLQKECRVDWAEGEEFQKWKEKFRENRAVFWKEWSEMPEKERWILDFYLAMSCELLPWYQENGWEHIFEDTFYDITLWALDYYGKTGQYGLQEVLWIEKLLEKKVFRLGRLEFETSRWEEEDYPSHALYSGRRILQVHIPAGEKMYYEDCQAALHQAKEFFDASYHVFVCDSWLLDPALTQILPKESNILKFQSLFEILKVHYDSPQAEERVYGIVKEKKEEYPERTMLQKGCKSYLLSGGSLGMGVGILKA